MPAYFIEISSDWNSWLTNIGITACCYSRNRPYLPAIRSALKAEEVLDENCQLRTCKYLNNVIEQDHRAIKRLSRAVLGFKSFTTARRTIDGYDTMNMIRKGQVIGITKGAIKKQGTFIEKMFGIAA